MVPAATASPLGALTLTLRHMAHQGRASGFRFQGIRVQGIRDQGTRVQGVRVTGQ